LFSGYDQPVMWRRTTSPLAALLATVGLVLGLLMWLYFAPVHRASGDDCGTFSKYGSSGRTPTSDDDETCGDLRVERADLVHVLMWAVAATGVVVAVAVRQRRT
jgi:hypothetical protein